MYLGRIVELATDKQIYQNPIHPYGVKGYFESIEKLRRGSGLQKDIFPKEQFIYDSDNDCFTCPAGQILKKRRSSKYSIGYFNFPLSFSL